MPPSYPIDEAIPRLTDALAAGRNVVLSAPPGAGKTTRVPLALMGVDWLAGQKVIMLEPRRLAARRAAEFMASQLHQSVGEIVGYRIRGETRVSRETRIEVVTEGVLTRILHTEPDLPNFGLVIFDEFHERSIHADLGLALTLDVQDHLRDDLRLLVMSATLDGLAVARILGDAPVIESVGRSYDVETIYLPVPMTEPLEARVVKTVRRALGETEGDILVFLPGQREIRRTAGLLHDGGLPDSLLVRTLFGEARRRDQDDALAPPAAGRRKIILSTSIAETSLTIDGVRVVVDSGLSRSARFDPRRGMSGLVTVPVSVSTADQRRGRAHRQAPGTCYRLWTKEQHAMLPRFGTPEILSADLAPLALDLARWQAGSVRNLRFIDPPPAPHLSQARQLLTTLGAVEPGGSLTPHGREMADLPVHPRLAHMIIRGKTLGLGSLACDVAALLEDRDITGGVPRGDIDFGSRLHALRSGGERDPGLRARILAESRRLRGLAGISERNDDGVRAGALLALAYPERVARRRSESSVRYLMAGGTGAVLPDSSRLVRNEFLALADVDGAGEEARVYLAAPVEKEDLLALFQDQITQSEELLWSQQEEAVIARRVRRLGSLILEEKALPARGDAVRDAIAAAIAEMGLDVLPWTRSSEVLRDRSEWLRRNSLAGPGWPDLSDGGLRADVRKWLGPFLAGVSRQSQLRGIDLMVVLKSLFSYSQLQELDRLAPEALVVPSGSRVRLDYGTGTSPVLAVRLQEMFGQMDTPKVGGGTVKVLIHLLSPARRPLAVTQDLRSFWANAYPEVRKQMRGRYPKHVWPENPLEALPTSRTVKRTKNGKTTGSKR